MTIKPIVIVEGPDGAGKTTLAEALAEALAVPYTHEGPPPVDLENVTLYYAQKFMSRLGTGAVFDRLALGELVYGPILRDCDRLGEEGFKIFEALRTYAGAQHIVCLPKYETCRATWAERAAAGKEYFRDEFTLREVYRQFDRWSRHPGIRVLSRDALSLEEMTAAVVNRF